MEVCAGISARHFAKYLRQLVVNDCDSTVRQGGIGDSYCIVDLLAPIVLIEAVGCHWAQDEKKYRTYI
jgi:hypothetical protein